MQRIFSVFAGLLRRLLFLVRRNELQRDIDEEMRLHVEQRARQEAGRGLSSENALVSAQRRFGNRTALAEQAREAWISPALESIVQDLRYAWRGLRRSPAFSLTAILVIAVGIGASTAVFSVVDLLLFRSLPYPDASRLVSVGITAPIYTGEFLPANDYLRLREIPTPFSSLGSMTGVSDCDLTENQPLRLNCAQVDSAFLPTFGIQPYLGRNFTQEEDRPNVPKVALISYGFWRSRLGGDAEAIGKTIQIDGTPTRVIGVLPQSFEMPNLVRADLIVPQTIYFTSYRPGRVGRPLRVFGRLKPGVTVLQAFLQLQPYFRREIAADVPPGFRKTVHPTLRSLRDYQVKNVKMAAWLLFGGTIVILLIVCANVASLLLARSVARVRELAVRAALGAGRWRLMRQIFTESGLLSLVGGASGCILAAALLHLFKALAPTSIPRLQQAALDGPILFFALSVTLACGVLFGLAPAFHSPRPAMLAGRTELGSSRTSLRHVLMAAQIALSLVLLSVAGLLLESLWKLESVAPGVSTTHVLTADITLNSHRYLNSASRQQFFDDLMDRLKSLPGVDAVAVSDTVPPSGFVHSRPFATLQVEGRSPLPLGTGGMVDWRSVTPEYFKALGIPLLRGPGFREQDRASKSSEFVLSKSLAHRLFGSENPVGKTIAVRTGTNSFTNATVVGVAADVRNNGLTGQSDPEYYMLRKKVDDLNAVYTEGLANRLLHWYDGDAIVIVRTVLSPEVAAKWIRSETAALDPTTPVTVSTMSSQIRQLSERPRFNALLLSSFALVGLLLASAGLYGLISYLVMQRRQEIGVRVAVGATPRQIAFLVLTHALRWTAAGILVGLLGTLIATRFLGSLLFEVSPENPILFSAAALILLAVAIAATLLPALRASRIDPMLVLRQE